MFSLLSTRAIEHFAGILDSVRLSTYALNRIIDALGLPALIALIHGARYLRYLRQRLFVTNRETCSQIRTRSIGGTSAARVDETATCFITTTTHANLLRSPPISLSLPPLLSSPLPELASPRSPPPPFDFLPSSTLLQSARVQRYLELSFNSNAPNHARKVWEPVIPSHFYPYVDKSSQLVPTAQSPVTCCPPSPLDLSILLPPLPVRQLHAFQVIKFVSGRRQAASRLVKSNFNLVSSFLPFTSVAQRRERRAAARTAPTLSDRCTVGRRLDGIYQRPASGTQPCLLSTGSGRRQANPTPPSSMRRTFVLPSMVSSSRERRVAAHTLDALYRRPASGTQCMGLSPPSTIQASSSETIGVRIHRHHHLCRRRRAAASTSRERDADLGPSCRQANAALDASSIGFTNELNGICSRPPLIRRRLHGVSTSAHRQLLYESSSGERAVLQTSITRCFYVRPPTITVSSSGERAVSITLITQHIVVRRATFAPDPFGRLGHRIHDVSKSRERRFCIHS
ncbi:hypothetical protein R3P38DRAFT_3340089 [Favolaschia claudopus]|uniref:Uncharacterized protein n=1 Tax=Favolaschia claudopus TaxID=2862362 RepID=A0AAW0EKF2_9AGAR